MENCERPWMKEFAAASRLADEITEMLSKHRSLPSSDPATETHLLLMRTRIAILGTRLWNLEADYARKPKQFIGYKNMTKRKEMLSNLREREKKMVSVLDAWCAAESSKDLPETSECAVNEVKTLRIWRDQKRGLPSVLDDNQRIISVARQIMKEQDEVLDINQQIISSQKEIMKEIISDQIQIKEEQDEVLDRLQKTVLATKHSALAFYEKVIYKHKLELDG